MYVHPDLYMTVYGRIIHNGPKLEAIQMSINWWMDKPNVVCSYNGKLFSNKKEWISVTWMNNTWMNLKNVIIKWKEPDRSLRKYNSIYMEFSEIVETKNK